MREIEVQDNVSIGTKKTKNRFLLYNILLDIVVSLLVFPGISLFLIIGNMAAIISLGLIIGGSLFFSLHAVFILLQLVWLKKLSVSKSIIYSAVLFGLVGLTYILPLIIIAFIQPKVY